MNRQTNAYKERPLQVAYEKTTFRATCRSRTYMPDITTRSCKLGPPDNMTNASITKHTQNWQYGNV
jgi:hypothetical protein